MCFEEFADEVFNEFVFVHLESPFQGFWGGF
jgi:hypothetical protein